MLVNHFGHITTFYSTFKDSPPNSCRSIEIKTPLDGEGDIQFFIDLPLIIDGHFLKLLFFQFPLR